MPTITFFADAVDGFVQCTDAVYANAHAGTGTLVASGAATTATVGQTFSTNYILYVGFLSFDTAILADQSILSATVSLWSTSDQSTTAEFVLNMRTYDWGATLTTADWRTPAQASADTLVASFDTTAGFTVGGYIAITPNGSMVASINKTGFSRYTLTSSRFESTSTPTGNERVSFSTANEVGTTQDPKLVVIFNAVLIASVGIFTLGGQDAGLLAARKISAAAGSFVVSGQDAALKVGRVVIAGTGVFTLSGQAAGLRAIRRLLASSGAYSVTGQVAAMKKGRRLVAERGVFTLSGQATGLYGPIPTIEDRPDWYDRVTYAAADGKAMAVSADNRYKVVRADDRYVSAVLSKD